MEDQKLKDDFTKIVINLVGRTEEYFFNNRCELSSTGDLSKYVIPETLEDINTVLESYLERRAK